MFHENLYFNFSDVPRISTLGSWTIYVELVKDRDKMPRWHDHLWDNDDTNVESVCLDIDISDWNAYITGFTSIDLFSVFVGDDSDFDSSRVFLISEIRHLVNKISPDFLIH